MIHNLYLTSIQRRKLVDPDNNRTALKIALQSEPSSSDATSGETAISSSIADDDFRWMSHTVFKSCQLMHVQVGSSGADLAQLSSVQCYVTDTSLLLVMWHTCMHA